MDIDFYQHYAAAAEAARGPAWRYDEMKPCGFNYNHFLLARVYDTHHQMFRDYQQETEQIVGLLGRDPFATVIDMADYKDDFLAGYVCTNKSEAVRAKNLTVADQQLR